MSYKYKPGDKVRIMSYIGAEQGFEVTVFSCYISDKKNHESPPHNRYVCYDEFKSELDIKNRLHDVSESELTPWEEYNYEVSEQFMNDVFYGLQQVGLVDHLADYDFVNKMMKQIQEMMKQ